MRSAFMIFCLAALIGCQSSTPSESPDTSGSAKTASESGGQANFAAVQQVLNQRCTGCHGENGKEGIDLRSYATVMKGGEHGAIVKPGEPENSKMVEVVKTDDTHKRMPLNQQPLSADQIATIEAWIKAGAKES